MHKYIYCLVFYCAVQVNVSASYALFSGDTNLVNAADSAQITNDSIKSTVLIADTNIIGLDTLSSLAQKGKSNNDTLSRAQRDSLFKSVRSGGFKKSKKRQKTDTSLVVQKKGKSPKIAGILSTLLPGAGQVYNGSYWKLAAIYGGAYLLIKNMVLYDKTQEFYHGALVIHDQEITEELTEEDIEAEIENYVDTYKNIEDYTDFTGAQFASLQQADVKIRFEDYRSTMQNMYVFSALLYGLNILDAVVDAHLKSFDVSDDLSMKIKPSVLNMGGTYNGLGAGISVKLSLK